MAHKTNRSQRQGFVLITVLVIVVLLTALLLQFNSTSRANVYAVNSFSDRLQALNCARAGLNVALAAVKADPDLKTNASLRNLLTDELTLDLAPGSCRLTLVAENGKLNINLLKDRKNHLDRAKIDQFLRLIDLLNAHRKSVPQLKPISYALAPALIDWTDADDQITRLPFVTSNNIGAESGYYLRTPQRLTCKNLPFDITEELLSVQGMTPEIFYGPPTDKSPNTARGMRDYLTVYGDGLIDLNAASPLIIQSLSEHITAPLAQMIVARRKFEPFTEVSQLRDFPGITPAIYSKLSPLLTTNPTDTWYRVTASGVANQATTTITAVISRSSDSNKVEIIHYREL